MNNTGNTLKTRLDSNRLMVYVFMTLFCLGELTGTILYCTVKWEQLDGINLISGRFFDNRLNCTFLQTVVNSFSGPFILLLLCLTLGFGAVFQPITVIIPFFRGLGIGITLAEINGLYGIKGMMLSLVMIVPYAVISAVIIIIGTRESVLMSANIGKCVFGNERARSDIDFNLYLTKFLVLAAALAASSLLDSLLTFMFAGLWTRLQGL